MSAAAIETATQIEHAVVQIRNADDPGVDCRWQERAAFMRPARIIFGPARFAPQDGISGADQAGFETSWEVVTTDLSPDGAGILSYSGNEPLPSRVTLVIDETAFDCDVRWSSRIGYRVYRHGLRFRSVQDNPNPRTAIL